MVQRPPPKSLHTGPRSVESEDCNRITTRQPTGTSRVHTHQRHSTVQRLTALRSLQHHNHKLHATGFDSASTLTRSHASPHREPANRQTLHPPHATARDITALFPATAHCTQ
ncbi:transcript antisense to ribosomal RNA protein [Echinococcus multilocularis]|uniref:Transcript antisense to ribosomal RNA protein n=1 Tax=Echinococcus multilocularis TaxID=6211 RepID=A0A0S4MLT1_ECHMU|nr:transcript antisense to ribosomal RNA protein [Echinococcus multilocularis]